jgi:membrane protease YdiL (CAAX protease family)
MSEKFSPSPSFPLQAALFEASLAFLAALFGWMLSVSPTETLRVKPLAILLGVLAVLPLLGLLAACVCLPWRPVREVRRVIDDIIVPMFKNCTWSEMAAISLLAGVGEELLFRGVLQAAMAEWTGDFLRHSPSGKMAGDFIALAVVAIVFGLLHAVNAAYAVLATLMGLYLGWLWMATGNLAVPIVAHAVYDFLALAYILRWRKERTTTEYANESKARTGNHEIHE